MTRTLVVHPDKTTILHIISTPEATGGAALCGLKPWPSRWLHVASGVPVCVDCLRELKRR